MHSRNQYNNGEFKSPERKNYWIPLNIGIFKFWEVRSDHNTEWKIKLKRFEKYKLLGLVSNFVSNLYEVKWLIGIRSLWE